jgi:tRNA(His) 5'-end guanylyltransferase
MPANNQRYEYVRSFERDEVLLPNMWIVVRIDGRGFHKFVISVSLQLYPAACFRHGYWVFLSRTGEQESVSLLISSDFYSSKLLHHIGSPNQARLSTHYSFTKPNDSRALSLMNAAASAVVSNIPDICVAYGVSDEYSFVFHKSTDLFERRAAKLLSTIVSTFTAFYFHLWATFMDGVILESSWLPTFDGRAVCFPSFENLRDYLSWRQVDCMIAVDLIW